MEPSTQLADFIAQIRTESNSHQLFECIEQAYSTIFEGANYIKNTAALARRLCDYFINSDPEMWHGKRIRINRDDHYIIYRFNEVDERVPRINIMAGVKRRHTLGVYGRMLQTKDPMIICPIVTNELWHEWEQSSFLNTPHDICEHIKNNQTVMIHELTHLIDDIDDKIDYQISDKAASRLVPGIKAKMPEYYGIPDKVISQEAKYLNKPSEFNARFIAAMRDAIAEGKTRTFDEFKDAMRFNRELLSIRPHYDSANDKRYLKWLYLAYEAIKAGEIK